MKKFFLNFLLFFTLVYATFYILQVVQEIPKKKKLSKKTEKNFIKWTTFKKEDPNVIFLGNSKIYNSLNPIIFDSITHLNSFNLATGSQSIIESYYYLKYALTVHPKIKYVIIGLSQGGINEIDYYHSAANAEYLDWSHRWDLVVNGLGLYGICCQLFPLIKYQGYIDLFGRTKKNIIDGVWIKGYAEDSKTMDSVSLMKNINKNRAFTDTLFDQEKIKYISKISAFCKSNNIKLFFTHAPNCPLIEKYYSFEINYIKKLSESYSIPFFYDYPMNMYSYSDFSSDVHCNKYGARKYTIYFSNWFSKLNN
jgi:hypothetical protein